METRNNKRVNKYERVMSRVYSRTTNNTKLKPSVTRHERPSSVSVGAKPSVSNVSSSVLSELPVVLNNYTPEVSARREFVVKPRKTLRSLDPATSPHRITSVPKNSSCDHKKLNIRSTAGSVLNRNEENWSSEHLRQCLTSRSHVKLKKLKDEIKAYRETDKHLRLRSKLYKSCGVVLDDLGQVAVDKAVQAGAPEEPSN